MYQSASVRLASSRGALLCTAVGKSGSASPCVRLGRGLGCGTGRQGPRSTRRASSPSTSGRSSASSTSISSSPSARLRTILSMRPPRPARPLTEPSPSSRPASPAPARRTGRSRARAARAVVVSDACAGLASEGHATRLSQNRPCTVWSSVGGLVFRKYPARHRRARGCPAGRAPYLQPKCAVAHDVASCQFRYR
jgi:hypothetical protein